MDKETYYALYGCFGIRAVMCAGQYSYHKAHVNRVRAAIQSYTACHKPNRLDLHSWLRSLVAQHTGRASKQSIQIGIVHGLQNAGYTGQEVYAILQEQYPGIGKRLGKKATTLRDNTASLRRQLTIV